MVGGVGGWPVFMGGGGGTELVFLKGLGWCCSTPSPCVVGLQRKQRVLPALPEEVIKQIRGVLRAVEHMDHPYVDLKARLLWLFTPKPADTCLKLIYRGELGDRRPIQFIEAMLALLPPP